ncbi:ATP-binding cassette domain-containing protein [Sphingorhabdus arenilitoris]|uniref:ATP-binding cassette domain-containing protein n=1 Tax=Sphingorhabdus arenilitoris TaxID=1490041 RepID=A0ABV8RCW1_9SPHN
MIKRASRLPSPRRSAARRSAARFTNGPAVHFRDVTHHYGGAVALDTINVEIEAGSFVALVGASGSGKSTLMKSINRLITPAQGDILIDGKNIRDDDRYHLRRSIGYVIQGTGLFPHLTVAANILIGLRISGRDKNDARVAELLDMVDLPQDFAQRMPDSLSGGQQQRVGFARALAIMPGLMLMDEPFGALDPVTRDALGDAYRKLHDRLGLTTIMVTHDMAEALLIADRIIVLDAGRIVADAQPSDLLNNGGGDVADALVAVPRAQARKIAEMLK